MDARPDTTLQQQREALQQEIPWTTEMLAELERDQFRLTHVRHVSGPTWFVRVCPPENVQQGFGLAPEVLVVAVRGKVQARDLQEARAEVVRSGLRLDGNLVIVTDREPGLAERLERLGGHGNRVPWPRATSGTWAPLSTVLRAELPSFDAYEELDPIRGAQLVGRETEIATLRTRIVRGDAVGLFGLRKMGKTSVMRAVTDQLDPASGAPPNSLVEAPHEGIAIVTDASTIIDRTVDAVADELLAALARRMRAAGAECPAAGGRGLAGWKSAGEALLDRGERLCVVIDEFDLLFEDEAGGGAIPGIGKLFRLLRGWAQTRQGYVSLILVGRDPTYLAAPELEGVTNPLLAWYAPMWLGPLSDEKAVELLRKLGRRVGLKVGHESAALAQTWTGGHPLLQRQFGSALRAATREHDAAWSAPTDPYAHLAPARFQEREAVLEVMREVVALLRKRYPAAFTLLHDLALGAPWDDTVRRHDGLGAPPDRTLRDFGLVTSSGGLADGLRWYMATYAPTPQLRQTA